MLQVKDPQEVFDEIAKPFVQTNMNAHELGKPCLDGTELLYRIFVLGEMYGTISTCLAQNIPIPKELWDMPVVRSFVRGDVNDVFMVDENMRAKGFYQSQVRGDVDDVVEVDTINPKPLIENKGLIIVP